MYQQKIVEKKILAVFIRFIKQRLMLTTYVIQTNKYEKTLISRSF